MQLPVSEEAGLLRKAGRALASMTMSPAKRVISDARSAMTWMRHGILHDICLDHCISMPRPIGRKRLRMRDDGRPVD